MHELAPTDYLDKIYANGLPVNTILDKGRCGIGATTIELLFKERCSLIVVPNTNILINKQRSHPEIDIVYGDVHYTNVVDILRNPKQGHKIMSTPDGVWKIFKAAKELGRLDDLYNNWFLLLDEAHAFITEVYRGKAMLRPFQYFWNFKSKSLMSATPYEFSNPKFKNLHYVKIRFTASLGKVCIVNCRSVEATLNWILDNRNQYPGNLHVFYNSVTEISLAVQRASLDDCTIFCANDEENGNLIKLGDNARLHSSQPETGSYKKVNFYTCKYFEGWDLKDENATVILVTNHNKTHTKVGVSMKGKQAIGRLRDEPYEIMHLTNHENRRHLKTICEFKAEYTLEAMYSIEASNQYVAYCQANNLSIKAHEQIKKYADIDEYTQLATLNWEKLDQQINDAASGEIYNHIDFIQQAWKDAYYDIELIKNDLVSETATLKRRKSAAKQLEEDYNLLKSQSKAETTKLLTLSSTSTIESFVNKTNPQAFKAFQLIDEETMSNLKYNVKKVEAEIIRRDNSSLELKFRQMLNLTFKIGGEYTNKDIKEKLQTIYTILGIKAENGKIMTATASQLSAKGLFEVEDCKVLMDSGTREHGKRIIRTQFNLRMAA
ncbi:MULTISPECIES: hypothetical protein [unclassified Mucilaginibacter]|uniref:hypothetical protein n=1 Tax=unclassified Mucilaginibacter TaxID=2617802 RepID=UPI0033916FE7